MKYEVTIISDLYLSNLGLNVIICKLEYLTGFNALLGRVKDVELCLNATRSKKK